MSAKNVCVEICVLKSLPPSACLPRKTKVDVTKCHACHAEARRCHQVPRLLRKVKVDVGKCHACHANQVKVDVAKCLACHTKRRSSATPATQNRRGDNGAKQQPSAPPEPAQCHKCHACHAKCRSMSPSATPTTQSEGKWCVVRVGKLCVCVCVCVSV